MSNVNATTFKNNFGKYLEKSISEPVIVEKSGRPSAVLISYKTFEMLSELEDLYWINKANEAVKSGFLGAEESEKRLLEYAKKAGVDVDKKNKAEVD